MNHAITVTLTRHCPDRPPLEAVVGACEYGPTDTGVTAAIADLLNRIADEVTGIAAEVAEADAEGALS